MYSPLQTAIVAAREDEALTHGQVLYGLIKPTKDMEQIESTAAMVNVIPKQRIYRMEKEGEIDLFMEELMKRPLVLQPSAYIGRGLAAISCAFCTREERWVMLVNQAHPKILRKLQAGVIAAKSQMAAGKPFVLQLSFKSYLNAVYLDSLTKAALDPRFTFIEFEGAEIVIRYPGDIHHRGAMFEKNIEINIDFDDLLPREITRRTVMSAQTEHSSPALRVIMPDEINQLLPGWAFEQENPLASVIPTIEEPYMEGAVGGIDIPPQEVGPPARIVGRAKRKAGNSESGNKQYVPVELHVPNQGGPQVLHHGNVSHNMPASPRMMQNVPRSPNSQMSRGSTPPPSYENLERGRDHNEHHYEGNRVQGLHSPRSPHSPPRMHQDSPYEEMNVNRQYNQQYPNPQGQRSPGIPMTSPRTPTSPRHPGHNLGSPRTPQMPHSPANRSPHITSSENTPPPQYNALPPQLLHNSADRYNNSIVTSQPSKQTYLTDNDDADDGGFSTPNSRFRPITADNKYDSNYNRNGEVDRYGNPMPVGDKYNSSDRYNKSPQSQEMTNISPRGQQFPSQGQKPYNSNSGNVSDRPVPPTRGKFPPSSRPVPSPRGVYHHHQGSGRSDTSTSDSGFGENENGHDSHRNRKGNENLPVLKNNSYGNGVETPPKTPYYNHAYEQDSPDKERVIVDDIMAKHKALAAKMLQEQGQGHRTNSETRTTLSPRNRQDYYNEGKYGKELQKVRQNINDLENACDVPDVNFSRSRLHMETHGGVDQVEESFI